MFSTQYNNIKMDHQQANTLETHSQVADAINIKSLIGNYVKNLCDQNDTPNYSGIMKKVMIKPERLFNINEILNPEFMQLINKSYDQKITFSMYCKQVLQTQVIVQVHTMSDKLFVMLYQFYGNYALILLPIIIKKYQIYYNYWVNDKSLKYFTNTKYIIAALIVAINPSIYCVYGINI